MQPKDRRLLVKPVKYILHTKLQRPFDIHYPHVTGHIIIHYDYYGSVHWHDYSIEELYSATSRPSPLRRNRATQQAHNDAKQPTDHVPVNETLREPPKSRINSRRYFVTEAARLASLNRPNDAGNIRAVVE